VLELSLKTLLAYFLGSLIGSLLVGRLRGIDIRTLGSGNAGGTNALRTQGARFALAVIVIDVGKAMIAVGPLPGWSLPGIGVDQTVDRLWLAVACAIAVVVGHVYPLWYEFRGGKGAATLVGAVAMLSPLALVPVLAVWLVTVTLTGYVGLSTMLGAATLPVYYFAHDRTGAALLVFGCAMALFVVFTHRSNIERMWQGNENRARRLWLLRPR
jgi:acyl phosphate:glycerol-3-phosphate acyltransferase